MSNHLIIGISGQIGYALFSILKENHTVYGTYNSYSGDLFDDYATQLDISDNDAVARLINYCQPDVIWLPGAITNVDFCENNEDLSYQVNVAGVQHVANAIKDKPCSLVFFSSDYIFDGYSGPYKEIDVPNPQNIYGQHKLLAENIVKEIPSLIIRTSWVYGLDLSKKNFVYRLVQNLSEGKKANIRPDSSCPTYASDLAQCAIAMVEGGHNGIINICGPKAVDKYSWAVEIAESFGLDVSLIEKDLSSSPIKRPQYGGLDISKLQQIVSTPMRSFSDCVEEMKKNVSH
jgi:dTDP-4-dehydrorhamnose reductase